MNRLTIAAAGFLSVSFFCFTASTAQAHPADDYTPKELNSAYGTDWLGADPAWSINDVTFTRPYPDPATLTGQERYMIAGATLDSPPAGLSRQLQPWYQEIYTVASAIHARDGYLPAVLDEDMVRSMAIDPDAVSQAWVDHFRNPLTGEFPRLDVREFSPGDVFIHVLTEQEKQYLASLVEQYDRHWYRNEVLHPLSGEWVPAHPVGDVCYIRVYGWNDVIMENIQYSTTPVKQFSLE